MVKCIKPVDLSSKLCSLTHLAAYHVISCIFTNNTMQPLKIMTAKEKCKFTSFLTLTLQFGLVGLCRYSKTEKSLVNKVFTAC